MSAAKHRKDESKSGKHRSGRVSDPDKEGGRHRADEEPLDIPGVDKAISQLNEKEKGGNT